MWEGENELDLDMGQLQSGDVLCWCFTAAFHGRSSKNRGSWAMQDVLTLAAG